MAQSKAKQFIYDGCTAAAHIAYAASDTAFIYPITPSSAMAEAASLWEHQQRKNVFGQVLTIRQMQSEAGAAGAVHGSLVVGTLTTTFTASQGLLLMIPNMYKIAGELLPCVFHVSARALAGQALSIFGDHSDVMAVRQTGFALLASASVQEAVDMALVSHMATLKSSVPFLHFFDGFRTSHELQKVEVPSNEVIHKLLDHEAIQAFRERALCPTRPKLIGTSQGPEVFFQNAEAANKYYAKVPGIVEECIEQLGDVTGRRYNLFDYYGPKDAEDVVVLMGAGYPVVCELSDYLKQQGDKLGVINVHLYRPWCLTRFIETMPKTAVRVAVLDKTREAASMAEPLFMDVAASFQKTGLKAALTGGRYGLGSKDFTPAMAMAVVLNMRAADPITRFVVGIEDDVTNLSLNYRIHRSINTVPKGTVQCMFWGMGSDGTVGANKNAIKIIGDHTPMQVQGYFAYSAHKAGGLTVSHLRFGHKPITSQYLLQTGQAEYVACHRDAYIKQFNIVDYVKEGGKFVLNCMWKDEDLEREIPATVRRDIARKNVELYTVNASKVAMDAGMGRRVNNVLMTIFFQLSGVLPIDEAVTLFKTAIQKTYGKKGQHVVEANWKAVDMAAAACHRVNYNSEAWLNAPAERRIDKRKLDGAPEFVTNVLLQLEKLEGDDIPVSKFEPGGVIPLGTAAYEKRGIALKVPIVDMDKCTQCNYCSFVCPHAAIRPFLLDEDEAEKAPEAFDMRRAKGANEIAPYRYRIQVSPLDCTGCELCAIACPDNCLTMTPLPQVENVERPNWDFAIELKSKEELCVSNRHTIKGSQFYTPLVEFSGACEGCGETPYVKLLTQLFGERLLIANATGCSSIWGASYPSVPYTKNQKGYGPAWGNSLFEDAAEYGYGMIVAMHHRREQLLATVKESLENSDFIAKTSNDLLNNLRSWVEVHDTNAGECQRLYDVMKDKLEAEQNKHPLLKNICCNKDAFPRLSHWIIGGDGWAYDIGYGGLDHVIASGANINILVLDTEVYSNTGGQISKATPTGAVHKFSFGGNLRNKKDLGMIVMEYGNVYVASVSSSANMTQTVRAFVEAESYPGPSLILAYSPCIEHGYIRPFSSQIEHCKLSVDSGYWPLYRYNPINDPPLQMDVKKMRGSIKALVQKENRFAQLRKANPEVADLVEEELDKWVKRRWAILKAKSEKSYEGMDRAAAQGTEAAVKNLVNVLYGSETGNSESVAKRMADMMRERGLMAKVSQLDEVDMDELVQMKNVIVVCSTAGQGEYPMNAREFAHNLFKADNAKDMLSGVRYAVFGLGDSSYILFNEAAKKLDARFAELGAQRLLSCGMGDDQHEEKFDTELCEWMPEYWIAVDAPEPQNVSDEPPPPMYSFAPFEGARDYVQTIPQGAKLVKVKVNRRLTPDDYDVEIRHIEFDLTGTGMRYALGDSLAVFPHNQDSAVEDFCAYFGFDPKQWIKISKATAVSDSKKDTVFAQPMSVKQLLVECLDVFGRPNRRFYEVLYRYCSDPEEKARAKALLAPENKEAFRRLVNSEMVNHYDMLRKFPSLQKTLTLEQLIDLVPLHKPRYYSIASSQKFVGNDELHLCVGVVDWVTEAKEKRFGTATSYLRAQIPNDNSPCMVAASLKATAFNLPPNDSYPIITAGLGTGLAPFRAFIQYRAWLKRSGKVAGPVSLYFGCRYSKKDFIYGEELKAFEAEGVLTDLKVAFSRDQKEKFYVQHHIDKDPALFYKRLITQNGFFYLCGSAKQVPIDIRAAVVRCLISQGGMSEEEADKAVTQMQIKGQYNVEAW